MKKIALALLLFSSIILAGGLKGQNFLREGVSEYRLYIKFAPDAQIDLDGGIPKSYNRSRSVDMPNISALIPGATFKQLLRYSAKEKATLRTGNRPPAMKGAFDRLSFSGLVELEGAAQRSPHELLALATELETYAIVEYCEIVPVEPELPPGVQLLQAMRDSGIAIPTPPEGETPPPAGDYTSGQFYLYGDQGGDVIGIYADYAWGEGITGQGVSFADVEWGWDYLHEDFVGQNCFDALTTTNHNYDDHGTSVLGEMYSANNGFGVTGAVYGADAFYGFSEITSGRTVAILEALDSLEAGDILVYEMQIGGLNAEYVPADFSQLVWDVTKTATDAGVIVVAAAGNGNQNLDDPYYADYMARGDNGSIIVGAGTKVGRNKASFSTYGSRVNLCGIGDWTIYSTGGGDLFNGGTHATYTSRFSGTSSSTPIVASAAIAVQSYAKNKLGKTLTPIEMRALLIETGTPQGTGGHIGPLPNVKAAIEKLNESGQVTTYTLTVTNGSGSGSYAEGVSVPVSAQAATAGFMFNGWSGDTHLLANAALSATTLTMPASAASIEATYIDTTTPLDTSNLSINLVRWAGWEALNDTYGSRATLDTTGIDTTERVEATLTTVADNTVANEYAWALLGGYLDSMMTNVTLIKVSYSADSPVNLSLDQPVLTDEGTTYLYLLPAATDTTLYLPIANFAQPDWLAVGDQTPLDLSIIAGVSFQAAANPSSTNLSVSELRFSNFDYDTTAATPVTAKGKTARQFKVGVHSSQGLQLSIPENGTYFFALYTVAGRQVYRTEISALSGSYALALPQIQSGIYIVQLEGLGRKITQKVHLR